MYYYYHHHHNRGIQEQINRADNIRTINSIRIQFNYHEEPGLGNKTSHIKEWLKLKKLEGLVGGGLEDVRNISD